MPRNSIARKILIALVIGGLSFLLLITTLIFYWLFQGLVRGITRIFISQDLMMTLTWLPSLMHGLFLVVTGLISWLVFRSGLGAFWKAIYMSVPVALVLVSIGMFFSDWPVIAFSLGALFSLGILFCFYRTKQLWVYYYSVILVSLALAIFSFLGGEI